MVRGAGWQAGKLALSEARLAPPSSAHGYPWFKGISSEPRGMLLYTLVRNCAKYIECGNISDADSGLAKISHLASSEGDPFQRLATYFSEALTCQLVNRSYLHGAHHILSKPLSTFEDSFVKGLFFELYPFQRVSYAVTNQAIIEAMTGLQGIHILDLSAPHDATQWVLFMQSLKERCSSSSSSSTRPQQRPYLKITCVHTNQEVLAQIKLRLTLEADKFIQFEFNDIVSTLENLNLDDLPILNGEPVAISIVLQLHRLLSTDDPPVPAVVSNQFFHQQNFADVIAKDSYNNNNHNVIINQSPNSALALATHHRLTQSPVPKMECFLHGLWKLQPKVMVIMEQESNVNGQSLTDRVDKALYFYAALFDCLVTAPSVKKILVERAMLGEQIKNIIACEGAERKERYESLKAWISRLELAGFCGEAISLEGMLRGLTELQNFARGYKIIRDEKFLFLCWNNNPLFSLSAWRYL
ncbi:Scarecrow-like protein [Arachis hypogaea]|nr:Scarecrow-like protein [Arachis hypogaea]